MDWKELFSKFKSREDYFEAEAGSEQIGKEGTSSHDQSSQLPAESTHDADIMVVGGKHYRKIKLKIVAAWDEQTSDTVAQLEETMKALREKNLKLQSENERLAAQHALMQQLNANLYTLRVADIDKSTDRIAQLETKSTTRQLRIRELEEQLRDARLLIHEARLAIERLEEENETYRKEYLLHGSIKNASSPGGLQWME